MDNSNILEILNYIGLVAFAISGAITASRRNLDMLGGYIIAFITALGGGTFRDLLLGVDVAWLSSANEIIVVLVGATIGILFNQKAIKWSKTLAIFDTIGIAVFTITGVQKGLDFDQLPLISVALGMITATFGGLSRDVLCNEIPMIFHKEIYAIPCLIGGSLYLFGDYIGLGKTPLLLWGCIVFIIIFRTLAVRYSWRLPLIRDIKLLK